MTGTQTSRAAAAHDAPQPGGTIIFAFPPGYSPSATKNFFQCGANIRGNRYAKDRITKQIRGDVINLARAQKTPAITCRVDIVGVQHPAPGQRTHDAENIAPLVKAAVDGLRDAGVLVNDSPKYVRTVSLTTGERVPGGQLVLQIFPEGGPR